MDLITIDWPFTIRVNSLGEPVEELWIPDPAGPKDLLEHAFDIPYGLPVAALLNDHGEYAFLALGHGPGLDWRRLVATANRHMRRNHDWANLLDDTTPGAMRSLRALTETWAAFAVPIEHSQDNGWPDEVAWNITWTQAGDPSAVPVTLLDLKTPLDDPHRLRNQVDDLRRQLRYALAELDEKEAR
ncbi:hypothetical protein AB0O91_36615 [Kitasatospora sp. NPDC089797]|uniref:hypothetical protein n=1 Tax=Kitasatospora sp. NPDC089797 TaxID=3155298 RepID=UPI0034328988